MKQHLIEAHQPRWGSIWVWLAFLAAIGIAEGLLLGAVLAKQWWLVVPLILIVGHLMHAHLMALHEAAHGTLCPNQWCNEIAGIVVGNLGLLGFSLYRAAHHSHHAYLATERDEELWPFVLPHTSKWLRRAAAVAELFGGLLFTPLLFLRTFLRHGSPIQDAAVRRRIWAELILMAMFWSLIVAATAWWHAWHFLLLLYVAPALLAGNMQSWRKYIEHMGLTGSTVLGSTRSVVASGPLGRLVAWSLFNVSYHGVHHQYAKMPQAVLPEFVATLKPTEPDEVPPFSSYHHALWDMLRSLANPRVGPQWVQSTESGQGRVRIGKVRVREEAMASARWPQV